MSKKTTKMQQQIRLEEQIKEQLKQQRKQKGKRQEKRQVQDQQKISQNNQDILYPKEQSSISELEQSNISELEQSSISELEEQKKQTKHFMQQEIKTETFANNEFLILLKQLKELKSDFNDKFTSLEKKVDSNSQKLQVIEAGMQSYQEKNNQNSATNQYTNNRVIPIQNLNLGQPLRQQNQDNFFIRMLKGIDKRWLQFTKSQYRDPVWITAVIISVIFYLVVVWQTPSGVTILQGTVASFVNLMMNFDSFIRSRQQKRSKR